MINIASLRSSQLNILTIIYKKKLLILYTVKSIFDNSEQTEEFT